MDRRASFARHAAPWLFWFAALAANCAAQAQRPTPPQQLHEAVRSQPGEAQRTVSLPDMIVYQGNDGDAVLTATYRLRVELETQPGLTAIYLPGVFGHARVTVNGHLVADRIRDPLASRPRGAGRLLLATVPMEILRAGANDVEVTLAGSRQIGLSRLWVGDENGLREMHSRKLLWQVTGPIVAAAVIMALSLCVLVLWARRTGETLYAYFGVGGLLWALQTVWTVLPDPLLKPPHLGIWWTMGYPFFVTPLVIFCVRLAQWRVPRFERALWVGIVVGPPLLYGAHFAGVLDAALACWRLVWIGAVAVGVFAVGRYALQQRNTQSLLLLGTGAVALAFGGHDWMADQNLSDNNPVFLTSFSGLLFFPLIAWILIDGFVQTTRELERLNVELERRVANKSAQLMQALNDMRAAKDAAETANRAKSSFLAAASHDLRQPAHALGLYMAALRAERLSDEQRELVERMTASIGALDTMFNALLDISRMDAGAVVAQARLFALEPMLHRLAEEFSQQAAEKGLRLSVRVCAAARRLHALSDPILVERIVRNLLGNAVKYTCQGGVLLTCRLAGGEGGRWQIEVWDTGPGIPEADHERVFDEFFQLGNPERDRAAGLGLGLSIVRRLAQLLKHRVRLHSVVGCGSRFVLELPASTDTLNAVAEREQMGSLQRLGVGVLDDDPEVRQAMRVLLERWGCVVTAGASVDELLAHAGDRPAESLQVLIVDFQLRGGSNGIDAIRALRQACAMRQPALIVSGASAPERLAELQASGFEWMTKPLPPADLRSWLLRAATSTSIGASDITPTRREALASSAGVA